MKAQLHRIAARLSEPWLIRQESYLSLHRQFISAAGDRIPTRMEAGFFTPSKVITPTDCCEADVLDDVEISNGIALLHVDGILGKHLDFIDTMCGGCDMETLQRQALALQARNDVHTVVIRYNSPGGAAAGIADCAQCLRDLAVGKRLISYIDDACSAAYWLAAMSPEIYGGQSCMVGSIGIICTIADVSEMYAEAGIKMQVFTDGQFKGAGTQGTSLTAPQAANIQERINHMGGMFKDAITTQRPSVAPETMQGQWFYGDTGLELGLIDAIAPTLEHVVALALQR